MKKQILNLGKALTKAEQKEIFGGYKIQCYSNSECGSNAVCSARGLCVYNASEHPDCYWLPEMNTWFCE